MTRSPAPPLDTRRWFCKGAAGFVLGPLAWAGAIGSLGRVLGVAATPQQPGAQLLMWLLPPCWTAFLCACFLFRSAARAWLVLGAITAAAWAVYLPLRWELS